MPRKTTRRTFLGQSATAAAGVWTAGTPLLAQSTATTSPANDRLDIAVIGLTRRGGANLVGVRSQNIVAICDVDENLAAGARKAIPKAKFYTDFRRIIDQKNIDAVVVSTPDHTHAPATMMALRASKHVYCEKPLTHSVHETRMIAETAAKNKCVTQMGIQIHAKQNYRRVVELIRAGAIGPVTEVHIWCNGAYAPGDRPKNTPPIPKGLHYDEWLGPAAYRPYHPKYHPGNWRGWWDFGGGRLGDMGCHVFDLAHWSLDLTHPTAVEAKGPPVHKESAPAWLIATWDYPARGSKPPVKLTWYDGNKRPPMLDAKKFGDWALGLLFVGRDGQLVADYDRHVLLPAEKFKDFERPKRVIRRSIGHHREWIKACKTGGKTLCGFDYAGPLTESVLLGIVAYRAGRRIEWDHKSMTITNAPEAMKYLRSEYRKGWTL